MREHRGAGMSIKHIIGWVLMSPFIVGLLVLLGSVLMDIIGDIMNDGTEAAILVLLITAPLVGLFLLLY